MTLRMNSKKRVLIVALLLLMAPTAFAQGIGLVATFEQAENPLDFGSMHERVGNFSFASALAMLALDTVLYSLLGLYLDEALPKQFGIRQVTYLVPHSICIEDVALNKFDIRQHPLFCLRRGYWTGAAPPGLPRGDRARG